MGGSDKRGLFFEGVYHFDITVKVQFQFLICFPLKSLFAPCLASGLILCAVLTGCSYAAEVAISGASPAQNDGKGVSMRVLWTVGGYHLTDKAEWSEEQAKSMLFKPLDVGTNYVTFDGQTCQDVVFNREEIDLARYLQEHFRTSPHELGIEGSTAMLLTSNCSLPGFGEYLRLGDARLLVPMHGVLFILNPRRYY